MAKELIAAISYNFNNTISYCFVGCGGMSTRKILKITCSQIELEDNLKQVVM